MAGDGGAVERSTTGRSHLDARQRVDAVQGRHSTRRANAVAIVAFSAFIALMGWIEIARPLGIRFADLTGGVVTMDTMVRIGILTIVVVGLNLLMGYAGQISLGHGAFYGLGAYGSAILTTRLGWSPWLAVPAAAGITALAALLFGLPTFRLRGHYLAMGTLALGFIVELVLNEWKAYTGGPTGLPGIPRFTIAGEPLRTDRVYFYLVWACALVALLLGLNLVNSRWGRALRAIRASEQAAQSLGIDVARFKLLAFIVSAVYASVAGSLYGVRVLLVRPMYADVKPTIRLKRFLEKPFLLRYYKKGGKLL